VPVHGDWKTMVRLHEGRSLLAIPIYLPEDKAIPVPEVPAQSQFTRTFVDETEVLQGAAHLVGRQVGVVEPLIRGPPPRHEQAQGVSPEP